MQRGRDDVRGLVVAKLNDEFGKIGLNGMDAGGLQRVVEIDLLGGHRLDLDDFVGASCRFTISTAMRLASAASAAQWT